MLSDYIWYPKEYMMCSFWLFVKHKFVSVPEQIYHDYTTQVCFPVSPRRRCEQTWCLFETPPPPLPSPLLSSSSSSFPFKNVFTHFPSGSLAPPFPCEWVCPFRLSPPRRPLLTLQVRYIVFVFHVIDSLYPWSPLKRAGTWIRTPLS